jgi:hypothetical protein
MYDDMEVNISGKYMAKVLAAIDEPIVVLGGWAVRFLVNDRYREYSGRDYLGSRDIDLGFHIGKDLENSAFARALDTLEKDLGFVNQSFRLFKETHSETGEDLTSVEAKKLPSHMIFPMYVDLIVDTIPSGFKARFGFSPIDEPLIAPIFADQKNRIVRKEFGKTIWLPTTELMLAMKIRSHPERDKVHKRLKDMCDISALLLFRDLPRNWQMKHLSAKDIENFEKALTPAEIDETARIIGIDPSIIRNALENAGI